MYNFELGKRLLTSRIPRTRSRAQRTQGEIFNFRFLIFDYWRVRKWECDNVGMLESGFRVNVAMRPAFAGHVTAWAGRAYARFRVDVVLKLEA